MDQNTNVDQNANTEIPVAPVVDNKQKSGKGLKITTAIACIVAVCGIGFGVYGMIDSNFTKSSLAKKETEINTLKDSIDILNKKIAELETQNTEQQNSPNQDTQNQTPAQTSTTDSKTLTAEVQNSIFVLKNNSGIVVAQDDTKNIIEIISCDSGTANSNSLLKCTAKTADGKSAWFIYDYSNEELKSGYSADNY